MNETVLLEEYKMPRAESIALVDETRKIEVMVVGAVAALYAWVLSHDEADRSLLWFSPLIIFLGGMRAWGLFVRTMSISAYMKRIEAQWHPGTTSSDICGWERYLHGDGKPSPAIKGANVFLP